MYELELGHELGPLLEGSWRRKRRQLHGRLYRAHADIQRDLIVNKRRGKAEPASRSPRLRRRLRRRVGVGYPGCPLGVE